MKKTGIKYLIGALILVIAFALTISVMGANQPAAPQPGPSASITSMNVCGSNHTGQTANDLELYIKGHVHVVDYWNKDKFNNIVTSYDPATDTTTVRFYNGTVFDGESIHACIKIDGPDIEEQVRTWTLDGKPIGPMGPCLSTRFGKIEQGLANIELGNFARNGGPLTVFDFQYGPAKKVYSLPELLWTNELLSAEIPWSPMQKYHLNIGENFVVPNVPIPDGAVAIVYRTRAYFDNDPATVFEFVGQYEPAPAPLPLHNINVMGSNNTGQTANDLEIYIKGQVNVLDYWNKDKFKDVVITYDAATDTTTIRFYNGTVFDGEEIHACIKIDIPDIEEQVRTWTLDGKPIGPMGPCLSSQFGLAQGMANIVLGNFAQNGGPITIVDFQYGPGKRVYPLSELLWSNELLNAEIPWTPIQKYHLNIGESTVIPAIPVPDGAIVVVYRTRIFFDKDPAHIFEYVGQIEPRPNVTPPPTIRVITPPPTIRVITPTPTVRVITPTTTVRVITPTVRVITPTPTRVVTPTVTRRPTPTPRRIYGKNVCGHNNTGKTANDLEIYLKGKVNIVDYWNRNVFANVTYWYDPVTDTTIVRFYNGIAPYCTRIHSCLLLDQPPIEVRQRTWTSDGTVFAPIGATVSSNYQAVRPGVINLTMGNYAQDGGPITITEFQYGPGRRVYKLEELVWDNPGMNEIPWSAPQRFHLNVGESLTLPSLQVSPDALVMVYRYKAYLDSDPANVIEYYEEVGPLPGYQVTYAVQSDWGTGAYVNVTITNNTPTAVNGWNLAWTFPGTQTITSLWNGTYTQSGASVTVKDAGFNAAIPANGGSVNFGFNLTYTGTNPKPTSFKLNGVPCQVQ